MEQVIGRKEMLMNEVGIFRNEKGVWFLAPTLSHKESMRSVIREIGETMRNIMQSNNG